MIAWAEVAAAALEHAAREMPRESCGLVVGGAYRPCRNLSPGVGQFVVDPRDVAAAEAAPGGIQAVAHSHPYGDPSPSQADRAMMERWGVPWLIVNQPVGHWRVWEPDGSRPPLVGREFSLGILDCYAVVRDHFALELGIQLPAHSRPDEWWKTGGDLYMQGFRSAGFVDVTGQPMRRHDVPLMQLRSPVPNHAAVYLGDGVILHHVMRQLSRREAYAGFWAKITRAVVRHEALC